MNTHESYVSLETAKMLKEAGFDRECISYYENGELGLYTLNSKGLVVMNFNANPDYMCEVSAPSLAVAQRWLREVKNMVISMLYTVEGWKAVCAYPKPVPNKLFQEYIFTGSTYDEALEAGINKCLTILIEGKK